MTNEEAVKGVMKIWTGYTTAYADVSREDVEAISMAIEALKKQIPQKAVGEHYAHMRCPSCNHRIPSGLGSSSRRRDNWCNYCGQAIDWGREDD